MMTERFQDENLRLTDFQKNVLIVCPNCVKRASVIVDYHEKKAKLSCLHCGLNKERDLKNWQMAGHVCFNAELWLHAPFRDDVFYAYNYEHLAYLENYIAANLREHKDRSHFTLLEKLPKFYHLAKNRDALIKLIETLKQKI